MRATSSSSGGFGARQRNWLGRWDRCRACVSTGRWAFYPIGNKSAACSCQTTIAAQSIRRMPCGQQIAKPAYSCLTIKNQNHYQLASLRSQLAAARLLRKSDTVNRVRSGEQKGVRFCERRGKGDVFLAEVVEGRDVAKGNAEQSPASRTPSRTDASKGLDGVREAEVSRHDLRQEPDAVILHVRVCAGGAG